MMIVALTAQEASFFHVRAAYPRSTETVKSSKSSPSQKYTGRLPGRSVSPERAEICRQKACVQAGSQLFFYSIPMRVDRGIDREETAVAAVSERYRGDNVFRVKPSHQLVAPRRVAPADSLFFAVERDFSTGICQ